MALKRVLTDWQAYSWSMVLVLVACVPAWGVCTPGDPGCAAGCGCGCDCGCNTCPGHYACPPNMESFGYYATVWRSWPGEVRVEQTFPQSIGVEKVPTPQGEVPKPLPKGTLAPPAQPGAAPGGAPGGGMPPAQGLPEMPAQPGTPSPLQPGMERGLPGLPFEEAIPPLEKTPAVPPSGAPAPGQKPATEPNKGSAIPPRLQIAPEPWIEMKPRGQTAVPAHDKKVKEIGSAVGYLELQSANTEPQEAEKLAVAVPPEPPISVSLAPLGLDGYCPVELAEREAWIPGDPQWTVQRDGHTYRFAGKAQRERFLADPERYAPACAGRDPVVLVEQRRDVPGRTEFCVVCKDRLYMFSGAASLAKFREDPNRYCSKLGDSSLR